MLAVQNRQKIFLILLLAIVLIILLWLIIGVQNNKKVPSRGTFVQVDILREMDFENRF